MPRLPWDRFLTCPSGFAGQVKNLSHGPQPGRPKTSAPATRHLPLNGLVQSPRPTFLASRAMPATIDDTYAEAFRSIYAAVLITARDRYWLDRAVQAATGNASSTILCDCEAGLDRTVDPSETPDNRPG